MARDTDRVGLMLDNLVAVVTESPLIPKSSGLGALTVRRLLAGGLVLGFVAGDGGVHSGEHPPAGGRQVASPPTLASST